MRNTNTIEINEIRKEWYRRDIIMGNGFKEHSWSILSLIVFGTTGIIIILISLVTNDLPLKISEMSLAVGVISFGIAITALFEAGKTDNKMTSLSNYHLLEIKGIIEDRRLTITKHQKKLSLLHDTGEDYNSCKREFEEYHSDFSFSFWKTLENLRQVQTMIRYSTPSYQLEFIDYFHKLLIVQKKGRDENRIQLCDEDKSHIRQSFDILNTFPAFNNYSEINEIRVLVNDLTSP